MYTPWGLYLLENPLTYFEGAKHFFPSIFLSTICPFSTFAWVILGFEVVRVIIFYEIIFFVLYVPFIKLAKRIK